MGWGARVAYAGLGRAFLGARGLLPVTRGPVIAGMTVSGRGDSRGSARGVIVPGSTCRYRAKGPEGCFGAGLLLDGLPPPLKHEKRVFRIRRTTSGPSDTQRSAWRVHRPWTRLVVILRRASGGVFGRAPPWNGLPPFY